MNIVKATRQYEDWLGRRTDLIKKDLHTKHEGMKAGAFTFLRATYYRWAQAWPKVCPELAKGPQVLGVGDLHIENFGTWRDVEGRLIWGVNDFDEAYPMSYANDLVRLAVSAHLACEAGKLALKHKEVCESIEEGYREALRAGGKPFVLGEQNKWLRLIAEGELRDPVRFWEKMSALPTVKKNEDVPISAIDAMEHMMPARDIAYRVAHRVAGLGSLGHARFVAIADFHGGQIAREAKALVPSANYWVKDDHKPAEILYQTIISRAVRCPDPFVQLRGRWIVRRLGPHCSRIELASLRAPGDELKLLRAMGQETANVHLGTRSASKAILRHMGKQKRRWLHEAAAAMRACVTEDWEAWKKDGYA